jgi:hypothetical protein
MAIRPPNLENLAAGQASSFRRPIHPTDCSKTSRIDGLPPGQPIPRRNRTKTPTIKGNHRFRPSGSRTRATRKTTKSRSIQGSSWGKVTSQKGTRSSYVTPNKNPARNHPKLRQENHKKGLRKSPKRRVRKATQDIEVPQ